MLSEENLATTVSSFDGQALHYVGSKCNKVFEQRRYNHIKDMKTKTKNTNGSNFNNGIKDGIQEQIQLRFQTHLSCFQKALNPLWKVFCKNP